MPDKYFARLNSDEFIPLTDEQYDKIQTWTQEQREAFSRLQENSGIDFCELLDRTSWGPRPGIGALVNPVVLGVHDFHGMFIGIEPDGYTHS